MPDISSFDSAYDQIVLPITNST